MFMIEEEHKKTDQEALQQIQEYIKNTNCKFCNSENLKFPFNGFEICNNCGKHTLFKERFHFLEISRELLSEMKPDVTKEKTYDNFYQNENKYNENNRTEGNYYYWIKLLVENADLKRMF